MKTFKLAYTDFEELWLHGHMDLILSNSLIIGEKVEFYNYNKKKNKFSGHTIVCRVFLKEWFFFGFSIISVVRISRITYKDTSKMLKRYAKL